MSDQIITTIISTSGVVVSSIIGMFIVSNQLGKRIDDLRIDLNRQIDAFKTDMNSKFDLIHKRLEIIEADQRNFFQQIIKIREKIGLDN